MNDLHQSLAGFRISTGVVRRRDLMHLGAAHSALVEQDIPHWRSYTVSSSQWGATNIYDWMVRSMALCWIPSECVVAVGDAGVGEPVRVRVYGGGRIIDEKFASGPDSPETRGPLREVRGIAGGRAYAVGALRQAYRRDGPDHWTCIDTTARPTSTDIITCFDSIDGFSETDIYAVGWGGEIWHYDGTHWERIESGTNLDFHKVVCADDGYVYACGQVGTLIRGRGSDWDFIDHPWTGEDFWGIECFQGRVYVSTMHFVYELVDGELSLVRFGDCAPPASCYHLSGRDGILWSIGPTDVLQFDGTTWTEIISLDV